MHYSCAERRHAEQATNQPESVAAATTDTLNFTSGIRAIFQDSKGNFWFGSLKEGVAVYDGQSFKYFTTNDGLPDNQIHTIQEDKNGLIWLSTQTGISSYDGQKISNRIKANQENAPIIFTGRNYEPKPSEWKRADSDLWFEAGNKSAVYRYDGQRLHYLELPPQKVLNTNDNLFAVTAIAKGQNNMIWFATYAGVFGYNGNGFTIINDETLGYDRMPNALHIRSIFEDAKGRLWLGNNGIGVLLKEGDSVTNFTEKQGLIHPNSRRRGDQKSPQGTLEHVFVIAEDSKGNIWFGDRDAGVWKYDGQHLENYTTNDGLANDFVLSIYQDRSGELWLGTANGCVYKFKGRTFEKQF